MRYLLDTHALLWLREGNPKLSRKRWEPVLYGGEHEILVSVVSLWEIVIKRSIGKLDFKLSLSEFSRTLREDHGFTILNVEVPHLSRLETLAHHHGDPFDRLLIAQTIECGAIAVTDDAQWKKYQVKLRW